MAKKPRNSGPTPVDAIRHKNARVNNPPKMLYPRDPSLDPQLVWKGKDAQDAAALEVPVFNPPCVAFLRAIVRG